MLEKIGFALIGIGGMMADSDCILIPVVIVAIGFAIMWAGFGRGSDDETA